MILNISIQLGVHCILWDDSVRLAFIHYSVSTCTIALNKYCCDAADSVSCLSQVLNQLN